MNSHFKLCELPMRRHDLIFVGPAAWHSLLLTRSDGAANALVSCWVDRGWPLIRRRAMPGEGHGVPLGLALPYFAGKKRFSFLMRHEDILSTSPPPSLRSAGPSAPRAWRPTLAKLEDLASRHRVEARVFGSLALAVVTGLDYLTDRSDLDLLLQVNRDTDLSRLTADLARIEAAAPMRLDGELIRHDGAAANWRELHAGPREVLVKTVSDVALLDAQLFLSEGMPS